MAGVQGALVFNRDFQGLKAVAEDLFDFVCGVHSVWLSYSAGP
jgi:hypothetical protein